MSIKFFQRDEEQKVKELN